MSCCLHILSDRRTTMHYVGNLAIYRSASLVIICGDVCQTPESWLVSTPRVSASDDCLFCAI